jgi:2-hydroxychromene-2-carboxylate isomerase
MTTAQGRAAQRAIEEELRRETERSFAAGALGSPFTVVDGEPFWGGGRLDQVDRRLATGG